MKSAVRLKLAASNLSVVSPANVSSAPKLLGFGGGVSGLLRGSAEGHLGIFTEHDGRADFKDEVRSGLGGRRVGLDLVGHGRGDVETEVAGFSRQRAVDLVGLVDDDIGVLNVERAVAEREGADFNAGFAVDVQRLGAVAWVMASSLTEPRSSSGLLPPSPAPSRLVTTLDVVGSTEVEANVIEPMATSLP